MTQQNTTSTLALPPAPSHKAAPPASHTVAAAASHTAAPLASHTTAPTNSDESLKMAIAVALLRFKRLRQTPPPPPHSLSSSTPRTSHWKQKAKTRKRQIAQLTEELKHLQDDLRLRSECDLYPESAACKCYFFNNLQIINPNSVADGSDHTFSDVLRRRFLRLVRLHKRSKERTSNQRIFTEFHREEEIEHLKISAEFLVDLYENPESVKKPQFANLVHQAVDFILGSLGRVLSAGKDATMVEGTISNLIMHIVKRMCTPLKDELCDHETDAQISIQHIIRTLASASFVGQRVLLYACHRISELAEQLFVLDPFDESFPVMHESMFLMIQLIEFLISDYIVTWSKDEGFDTRLFEEWLTSFLNARKTFQSVEKRLGIYALYMDRVTGELARQVCQVSSLQKLNQGILAELFS